MQTYKPKDTGSEKSQVAGMQLTDTDLQVSAVRVSDFDNPWDSQCFPLKCRLPQSGALPKLNYILGGDSRYM